MRNQGSYPAALESWWVKEAERVTGLRGNAALRALTDEIERMSARFTRERPEVLGDYTATPLGCAAYGVYFFPQAYARMVHALSMWQGAGLATRKDGDGVFSVLDMGSGTGAAGMAVASHAACHGIAARVAAVDRSGLALETAGRAFESCRELWPGVAWEGAEGDLKTWQGVECQYDMIVLCLVLNELPGVPDRLDAVRRMLGGLKPGGVMMVLEPAGEESGGALMKMRDTLVAEGFRVLAPCPHNAPCPMRGVAGGGFCHDVRRWRVPASLEFANRALQRTIWDVKVSYLVVGKGDTSNMSRSDDNGLVFRVVAPVTRTKAHVVTRGCCADGTLRDFELQCREVDKAELRAFDAWERGDLAVARVERLLGDGRTWRVKRMERLL